MKMNFLLLLFAISSNANCQHIKDIIFIKEHLRVKSERIYIFCRGTKSKSSLIAHRFNISDTNITHTGIGIYHDKQLSIYNVIDNSYLPSALIIDSLQSFIQSPDVYYLGVWECTVSIAEMQKAISLVKYYSSRKIFFDAAFNIENNDTLYCSEFCAAILNQVDSEKFNFHPTKIDLTNPLYQSILNRKQLIYYPVDFFQRTDRLAKIFEYRFNN